MLTVLNDMKTMKKFNSEVTKNLDIYGTHNLEYCIEYTKYMFNEMCRRTNNKELLVVYMLELQSKQVTNINQQLVKQVVIDTIENHLQNI